MASKRKREDVKSFTNGEQEEQEEPKGYVFVVLTHFRIS